MFQRHETDAKMRALCKLSFAGFARFLMDKDNYAFVPEKLRQPDEVRVHYDCPKCFFHLNLLIILALYVCMHNNRWVVIEKLYCHMLRTTYKCSLSINVDLKNLNM